MHYTVNSKGQEKWKARDVIVDDIMGKNTWGMKLKANGWKVSSKMWENRITGEFTHFDPVTAHLMHG
jgi:hypothetical protein